MKMMTPFMLQEDQPPQAPNQHNDEAMAPFVYPTEEFDDDHGDNTTTKTLATEEFSTTVTPSNSEDWSTEEYPSDEDDEISSNNNGDDAKVNGTGLVLYVTPTVTKAAYWKRRLGWKPNMKKTFTKKIKQVFRAPVRTHIRAGTYEIHGADSLSISNPNNDQAAVKNTAAQKDRKQVLEEEDLVLEDKSNDALGSVHHDYVFA